MQGYNLMVTGIIWMEVEDVMNLSSVRKAADWYYYDEEGHLVMDRFEDWRIPVYFPEQRSSISWIEDRE